MNTGEKNLEIRVRREEGDVWEVEIYNPNFAVIEKKILRTFSTQGEAYCWADTIGVISEVLRGGDVIRATMPASGLDNKLLRV